MHLKRKNQTEAKENLKKMKRSGGVGLKRHFSFGDSPAEPSDDFLADEIYIADGSRPYRLPTVSGQHKDLKSLNVDTVRDLINGRYTDVIRSFRIIDCRYPYEYEGGHIQNAENLYKEADIDRMLEEVVNTGKSQDDIIIFHCEFSSKRGPKMCRHLRNSDRRLNGQNYPNLYFPEIYILEGGYKEFFGSCKDLCEPKAYVPMLHEDYTDKIRHFRSAKTSSNCRRSCFQQTKNELQPQKLMFSLS